MRRMSFFLASLFISFVLISSSCSQQHDEAPRSASLKFDKENFSEVINQVKHDPTISQEDLTLFSNGIARIGAEIDSLEGKTVGSIIELQKEFVRKSAMTQMLNTSMNINHGFGLIGWEPTIDGDKKFDKFKYAIQNKSNKNIKIVEGLLKFYTTNNQLIRIFPIKIDQLIGVDSTQQFESIFAYDSTNRSALMLRRLMTNKSGNALPVWQPTFIQFGDESIITLGDDNEPAKEEKAK
jgi:hypothetical protein